MRINHNIQALNAYRNLYQNQAATSKNLEKLSSGLRINRAADDAAGLAISEKMRSQIRGLNQAETNSLDGVSLMQVAEGAMTEVHSMLQRMRELTVQAANDTNTTEDREAIQLEVDELLKEIDSIADKTEFNSRRLLDGSSAADTQYIVGQNANTNIVDVPVVKDAQMASGTYAIDVIGDPTIVNTLNQPGAGISQSNVIGFVPKLEIAVGANTKGTATATKTGVYDVEIVENPPSAYKITCDGETVDIDTTGKEFVTVKFKSGLEINYKTAEIAARDEKYTVTESKIFNASELPLGEYTITVSGFTPASGNVKANATIEVFGPDGFSLGSKAAEVGAGADQQFIEIGTAPNSVKIDVKQVTQAGTAKVQVEAQLNIAVSKQAKDEKNVLGDKTPITFEKTVTTRDGKVTHGGLEMTFDSTVKAGSSAFDLTNKSLTFQIGANTNQSLNIDVPQLSTVKLGIDGLNVLTHDAANRSLHKIDESINKISAVRAKLGATQNRLEHTISNLQVTAENLTSAESRIRDADMAKEMTEFTKNNILNQSAQAMLAQANQLPQGVLQLLQG